MSIQFENRTQTHEAIKSEIVQIMKLANDCHKRTLVYQPMTKEVEEKEEPPKKKRRRRIQLTEGLMDEDDEEEQEMTTNK